MIINTAVGVQRVPNDYMNVAKVLNLSEWKIITRILFRRCCPTADRRSPVGGHRLAGDRRRRDADRRRGIGFWVWDEWNNLNVNHILIAIMVIGIVGLLLERMLIGIARRFSYDD